MEGPWLHQTSIGPTGQPHPPDPQKLDEHLLFAHRQTELSASRTREEKHNQNWALPSRQIPGTTTHAPSL